MIKRILLSIVMLVLIAYLTVAITAFNRKPADQTCRDMELVIKDTAYAGFITKEELKGILQQKGIYPIGKKMERISTKSLERELSKHPLIDEAECYKTPSGKVCVEVTQRIPVMRVMADDGNYYVDAEGQRMAVRTQYQAHLPLVTGRVDSVLTYRDMLPLARYIYNHRFWNAQIEQIYVNERHEVELVPRVGDQTILLGSVQDFETKLDNLMLVYKKVFSKAGWAMYDTVSLKFKNQVVCTRKKK